MLIDCSAPSLDFVWTALEIGGGMAEQQLPGSRSLSERVKSLRLPTNEGGAGVAAAGVAGWASAPWLLVAILGATLIGLGWFTTRLSGEVQTGLKKQQGLMKELRELKGDSAATPSRGGAKGSTGMPAAGSIALESKGYIIPEHQILVSPQVSGRVVELNFEAGQRVEKDFVLAVLDDTEYQADFYRANAALEAARQRLEETLEGSRPEEIRQAKANLQEAQKTLEQSRRDLARAEELYRKGTGFIGQQELETARNNVVVQEQRVESLSAVAEMVVEGPRRERKRQAEAEVRQMEAELRRSKWRLDNTIITSPISGTILKKNAEQGNIVNPVAFNGSFSLCEMADLGALEVELTIQERDIAKVFKGQRCRVRAEAYPERSYDGIVSRLMPIADRAKGALPVRVRLTVPAEEEGQYLRPEMGAIVTFLAPEAPRSGAGSEAASR